jgi:hypothetical protein
LCSAPSISTSWLGLLIGDGAGGRPHRFCEERDDPSIEGIGLGQLPGSAGEVADLARIDDGHGQAGARQRGRDGDFIPASGFEDEHRGS